MEPGVDQISSSYLVTTTTVSSLCANAETSSLAVPSSPADDPKGALLFCVAVVCVYGLSIVAFIGSHVKKRQVSKDEERQVSHYLKSGQRPAAMNGNRFRVLRFKTSELMCSTLGQRHNHSATSWQLNAPSNRSRARNDYKKNGKKTRSNAFAGVDGEEFLLQTRQSVQRQSSLPVTALRLPGRNYIVRSASVDDEIAFPPDNVTYSTETLPKICVGLTEPKSECEATDTCSSEKTHLGKAEPKVVTVALRDNHTKDELLEGHEAVSTEAHDQGPCDLRVIHAQTKNTKPFRGRRSALFPV